MLSTRKRRLSDTQDPNSDFKEPLKLTKKNSSEDLTIEEKEEKQEMIFKNLRLRRILKENHGENITQLAFFFNDKNFTAPVGVDVHKTYDKKGIVQRDETDTSNVLATAGGPQVNVYDNEHCGDHLDIMSNFNLASKMSNEEDISGKFIQTFCWLYKNEDAWIAAGGADSHIHIISLAYSKELAILKGHKKRITDIHSHPKNDKYILSVSGDDTVRLWDVDNKKCVAIFEADASVACFHPSGESFITGNSKGDFRLWSIPESILLLEDDEPLCISKRDSRLLRKMHGDCAIDCIRFANGNILSKSVNGRMEYWDAEKNEPIRSFRVKTGENHSKFDVSLNDEFFCVGSTQGSVYIYNINTGKLISELSHRRSNRLIKCCVFSRDCRQVICGGTEGFMWRYDYISEKTLEAWENWKDAKEVRK
ncbi:unnamed protein product [Cunninghamella blakesleeana]